MLVSPSDLRRITKGDWRTVFGITYHGFAKMLPEIRQADADNDDDTYDLIKFIQFKFKKGPGRPKVADSDNKDNLIIEKLKKEIAYKDAQTTKILEKYVERSIAEQWLVSIAKEIRVFLEKVPAFRKQLFHMIHSDIAEKRLRDIFEEAMNQISEAK